MVALVWSFLHMLHKWQMAGQVAQVVTVFVTKHEALSSNLSAAKKKKKKKKNNGHVLE
jgi:hypothetical protein